MMRHKIFSVYFSVLTGLAFFASAVVDAQQNTASNETVSTYTWHDGSRKRTVRLNMEQIIEFNPDTKGQDAVKTIAPLAIQKKPGNKAIRIWSIKGSLDAKATLRKLKSTQPNKRYSEVFQEGVSGSGRKRALPGNVIVHLDPAWDQQRVDDWLAARKLQLVKKLDFGKNILIIKTAAGLASLEKANEIYNSGEVVAAYPNWWKEVSKK